MAATKQLVLAVESTAALQPNWHTIISGYLETIIRYFCGDKDRIIPGNPLAEVALVSFTARGPYSPCVAKRTNWTNDADTFLKWLYEIDFSVGGIGDVAIADGLAEALKVFPSVHGNQFRQSHCILVASQFYIDSDHFDAETVATDFKQNCISLSVICPRKLPKLIAIYNAAIMNPSETNLISVDDVNDPDYLVLISENFLEARFALMTQDSSPVLPTSVSPGITELPSNPGPTMMDLTQEYSYPVLTFPSPVPESPIDLQWVLANIPPAPEPKLDSSWASVQEPHDVLFGPLRNPNISNMMITESMTSSHPFTQTVMSSGQVESATLPWTSFWTSIPEPYVLFEPIGDPNFSNMMITGSMTSSFGPAGTSTPYNVVNDNVAITNVGPAHQTISSELQSKPTGYVKLWKGYLTVKNREGKFVTVTQLQAYRETTASESFAKDWPDTMKVYRLMSHDYMIHLMKNSNGKEDYPIFQATYEHQFLVNLRRTKFCAIIKLPTQMLWLFSSEKASCLNGFVFPKAK